MDDNLYPYVVVLTTKAKDRRLKRSVKEKLSTVQRNVLTSVLAHDTDKNILLSPQGQLFRKKKKKVYMFR